MAVGTLYVVATPIGNLGDITHRALETLKTVGLIAAEDTRVTKRLLSHFGLGTRCIALHDHNERESAPNLVEQLVAGEQIALVSDAGTPLVSDPGYVLINAARAAEVPIVAVPGPSALTAALSIAGMPVDRFTFEGFLPAKRGERDLRLKSLLNEMRTMVFYESTHRIEATLADIAAAFGGNREVALAHELTKIHESVERGGADEVLAWLRGDAGRSKGEFVLLVAGVGPRKGDSVRAEEILAVLLTYLPVSQAAAAAAQITGHKRNMLYQKALALQNKH